MDLGKLRKHELEALRARLLDEYRSRYRRPQTPKYGNLDKSFTTGERERFLRCVTNEQARTVFTLMFGLGLRVGEAVSLRTADVDLGRERLWVVGEKGGKPTMFLLHGDVLRALTGHVRGGKAGTTWLFPCRKPSNKYPHLSPNWVRNVFTTARAACGLDMVYATSTETYPGRTPRRLHRLVSHSCRHTFGHQVYDATHDLLVTQRLLRHVNVRNTQRYLYRPQEQLDNALKAAFDPPTHTTCQSYGDRKD